MDRCRHRILSLDASIYWKIVTAMAKLRSIWHRFGNRIPAGTNAELYFQIEHRAYETMARGSIWLSRVVRWLKYRRLIKPLWRANWHFSIASPSIQICHSQIGSKTVCRSPIYSTWVSDRSLARTAVWASIQPWWPISANMFASYAVPMAKNKRPELFSIFNVCDLFVDCHKFNLSTKLNQLFCFDG